MKKFWAWLREVPGWLVGVVLTGLAFVAVYARGLFRGRQTERLARETFDSTASMERMDALAEQRKRQEIEAEAAERRSDEVKQEAEAKALAAKSKPATEEQIDQMIEEAMKWPQD